MLKSIHFIKDYRTFLKGQSFTFKPGLNLLVGDQGSGKSTLLNLLANVDKEVLEAETDGPTSTAFLDLERGNPRTKGRVEHGWQAAAIFSSHGETNKALVRSMKRMNPDTLILVDEPDMALSIRSIYQLYELLSSLPNQIISSAHNPLLIELVGEVLSIEHNQWMSSKEFINSHKPKS
jgi:ABC-type lipoprotein export system ATPase subunit